MLILFSSHIGKNVSRVRVFFAQPFRKIGVSPSILLLAADGQRKNLLFRKLLELFHTLTIV